MLPRMANYDFTPQVKAEIWAAIRRHMPFMACPICGVQNQWEMPDGFVALPVVSNFWTGERASGLPSAALVCKICGHTLFFNLGALGLRHLLGPDVSQFRGGVGG